VFENTSHAITLQLDKMSYTEIEKLALRVGFSHDIISLPLEKIEFNVNKSLQDLNKKISNDTWEQTRATVKKLTDSYISKDKICEIASIDLNQYEYYFYTFCSSHSGDYPSKKETLPITKCFENNYKKLFSDIFELSIELYKNNMK